jgi:predicted amidohydrolase YtcJ
LTDAMTLSRIACVFCLAAAIGCAGAPAPDTVITNAKIFTSSASQPWAEALAIRGERIVAVGDSAAIAALAGSSTRRIDAGGRTIIPGINDAHQHVAIAPPHDQLELPFDPTVDQIAEALRQQVAGSPAGRLVEGEIAQRAWMDATFTREWLDAIAPQHPVRLTSFTGHGTLVNSRALALIGVSDTVKDPEGGHFGRDAQGRLDGRLEEYADYLSGRRLSMKTDPADIVASYRRFATQASGLGITSVQLMGNALPIADISKYLVEAATPIRWRVFRFPMREAGGETIDSRSPLPPQPTPLIDVRGMKWILDGTPIERFAFMREPYLDAPSARGRLNLSAERIQQFVGWAYGSEDPLAVHAVGDAAIDAYVSAVERAGRPEVWRAKRPRLEHGDMLSADLMSRARALGMVVVQNPLHFMLGDILATRLGPQRMTGIQPMRSLIEQGIPLAIGSDGPMSPFLNIMAAVTHPANPSEALTREQAVRAYTAGSAFAEFQERQKGQLAPGMLADLAVLSADLFTMPVAEMPAMRSVLTILGGRIVHDTGVIH